MERTTTATAARSARCRRVRRIDVVLPVDDRPRMPSRSSSFSPSPHPPIRRTTTTTTMTTTTTRRRTFLPPPMKLAATTSTSTSFSTTTGGERRFPPWMPRTASEARGPWSRWRVRGGGQRRISRSSCALLLCSSCVCLDGGLWGDGRSRTAWHGRAGPAEHHFPPKCFWIYSPKLNNIVHTIPVEKIILGLGAENK